MDGPLDESTDKQDPDGLKKVITSALVSLMSGGLTQLGVCNQWSSSATIFQSAIQVTTELCFRVCFASLIISVFLRTGDGVGVSLLAEGFEVRIKGHTFNKDCEDSIHQGQASSQMTSIKAEEGRPQNNGRNVHTHTHTILKTPFYNRSPLNQPN